MQENEGLNLYLVKLKDKDEGYFRDNFCISRKETDLYQGTNQYVLLPSIVTICGALFISITYENNNILDANLVTSHYVIYPFKVCTFTSCNIIVFGVD